MQVHFPDEPPVFDGANVVLRFLAEVDGTPMVCEITAEALEDHFGAESTLEASLRDAFERGRTRIHTVCVSALAESGGAPVVLHSGLFRVQALGRK